MSLAKWISCCAALLVGMFALAAGAADLPEALQKAVDAPKPTPNFAPAFDAANFGSKIDNPYYPLEVGKTMKYAGIKDGEKTSEDFAITRDRKKILGVDTTVVYDVMQQNGKLVEETYDWFAQDKAGNVWYFGEQTRALDKGKWTTEGSWQAGVAGAKPGIYMQGQPKVGDAYMQEFYQGHAGDSAVVLSLSEPITVPIGSYRNVQLTMEWSPDDPGSIDAKYYVKGLGVVRELAATGATEVMNLVKTVPTDPK
ncbi:MAG: hypothetical protein GIW99_00015 [Candidatus Eremiobacteraeota bacterium]|nr:hypothetical protein [Candidatus Eremiobacteraeota bacterium]MBC5826072.1 hypothetical protein [Candidatus Eremiobacteraeota bacterium]